MTKFSGMMADEDVLKLKHREEMEALLKKYRAEVRDANLLAEIVADKNAQIVALANLCEKLTAELANVGELPF